MKLSYAPLSMGKLQRMIDTSRLRTDVPIDITQLSATQLFSIRPLEKMGGIMLKDEVRAAISVSILITAAPQATTDFCSELSVGEGQTRPCLPPTLCLPLNNADAVVMSYDMKL